MTMPLLPFNLKLVLPDVAAAALGTPPAAPSEGAAAAPESFAAALEQAVAAQPNVLPNPALVARPATPEQQHGESTPFGGQTRKRRDETRARIDGGATIAAPTIALDVVAPSLLAPIAPASAAPLAATAEPARVVPNEATSIPTLPQRPLTEEALATIVAPLPDANVAAPAAFVPLDRPGEIRTLPIDEPIVGRPVEKHPVQRDPEALAAEFRSRLTRVMDRMRDEFGYNVEIVEAVRTPARQAALFAQGRTQPGPVVTWTLDSKHVSGNAVDVRINGGYDNPIAFMKLATLAREEGLQTLGPKDPGHIELPAALNEAAATHMGRVPNAGPRSEPQQATALPAQQPLTVANAASAGVARVAAVARVADVASVARVATVAPVATVATVGGGAATSPVARETATPLPRVTATQSESRVSDGEARTQSRASSPVQRASALRHDVSALTLAAFSGSDGSLTNVAEGATGDVAGTRAIDMSERVAAILDVHNRSQDRPVSSLLLRLEHPELGEDRLRVDLRNNSVGATLDVANARVAEQLNTHIAELQRALDAQGLRTENLTIRHAAQATEAAARVAERDAVRNIPLPLDNSVANALGARDNVTTTRSSTRSSDHNQQTPDQRQQRGRKDPQGGR